MGEIDKDFEALKKSLKSGGAAKVDENTIIKIIANRNNVMRQQLRAYYTQKLQRDLVFDLKSDLDGKFEKCILALFDDPYVYDAKSLHSAMKGVGTNTDTCIEIICSIVLIPFTLIKGAEDILTTINNAAGFMFDVIRVLLFIISR